MTAAEGFDPQVVQAFADGARGANLNQESAQRLLDDMGAAFASRALEQELATRQKWIDACTADKEFGGPNLQQNLAVAKRAMDEMGGPEFIRMLAETGMGSHPEVVRFVYRAGKAISEDTFVSGRAAVKGNPNPMSILYDNTNRGS